MIFSSLTFLFVFLPVVLVLYFCCPAKWMAVRNAILLVASLIFYGWGEPANIILILICLIITFSLSFAVVKRSKIALILSIIANVAPLLIYKYANFLILNFNYVSPVHINTLAITMPIGISFYTFQVLTYIIDLYRGSVKLNRNPAYLALYIFLFPQLIAGPIVRYIDVEEQIQHRSSSWNEISVGYERFTIGLAKKMLIANQAGLIVTTIRAQESVSTLMLWICVISYGVQILFDFSGYSDMSIGLGHILGFQFVENFNKPYISRSITEFWRRWHISLSTFFRDYVYIPMGGNRVSIGRHIFNLFIVWLLTGLWHGAYWNYALWGIYYFILLTLEKYVYGRWLERLPAFLSRTITFFLYMFGWAIFMFESNSLPEIGYNLARLFGFYTNNSSAGLRALGLQGSAVMVVLGLILSMTRKPVWLNKLTDKYENTVVIFKEVLLLILSVFCILTIIGESFNPFIYFRF